MDGKEYKSARAQTTYYKIRKAYPEKGRKSFSIHEQSKNGNGDLVTKQLKLEAIDTINKHYTEGLIDFHTANLKCKAVLETLYKERDRYKEKLIFNNANLKALDMYWRENYTDRDISAPEVMHAELRNAVESVGSLSLLAASREELQEAINNRYEDNPTKQRRMVARLNQILKFLGRNFSLRKMRKVKTNIRYVTMDEFEKAVSHLKDNDFQTLCWVAITTGLRLGEIFAVKEQDVRGNFVMVKGQLDRKLKKRETKTRTERKAFVSPEGREYLTKWLKLDPKKKELLRLRKHALMFKTACRKVFKREPDKHCCFHDLRHSYAIHLLQNGVPLAHVAQSLGNSALVCEQYYTGFMLSDIGVELIESIMTKSRSLG